MRRQPVGTFARALFPLGTYDEENGASAEVMKIESRFKVCRSASCKRMRVGSQPFAPAAAAATVAVHSSLSGLCSGLAQIYCVLDNPSLLKVTSELNADQDCGLLHCKKKRAALRRQERRTL